MKPQPLSHKLAGPVLAMLSGLLLAMSFPRFETSSLAWFALIPLFFAVEGRSPARGAGLGLITGAVFYLISLSWITNTLTNFGHMHPALSWAVLLLLVGYLSLYIGVFCFGLMKLSRGNPVFFFLMAPVLWTALEYIRSSGDVFGFSWQGLGYSQYAALPFIQVAQFTGVYGVSALIVMVNAGLFVVAHPKIKVHPLFNKLRMPVAILTISLLGACWTFGKLSLNQDAIAAQATTPQLKVGLVQGNIPQQMKWDPKYRDQVMQRYVDLTLKAASDKPDLIVWPEAVTPFYFGRDLFGTEQVRDTVKVSGAALVFGSPALVDPPGVAANKETGKRLRLLYNSAYLLDSVGETKGRYDKIHLVPFGEFVPYRSLLFFVEKMAVGIADFSRGEHHDVFDVKESRFGVNICYEIIFPDLVRQAVKNGAQFLVNITNDAWFGKSAASYQHISMAALRAVENGVPIVRAANTGITGFIDASGRIRHATDIFVEDVLVGEIQPRTASPTFYSIYGDVFSYVCLAFSIIFGFLSRLGPMPVPPPQN